MKKRLHFLLLSSVLAANVATAIENPQFNIGASAMVVGYDDSDKTSYKLNAGYSFNENFSLEANYLNFGTNDSFDGRGDASGKGYSVELLAKYPLGNFAVYAKLGNMWWSEKGEIQASQFHGIEQQKIDESGNDIIYGIGMNYAVFENFSIKLEYQESEINNQAANPFSIGFDFNF